MRFVSKLGVLGPGIIVVGSILGGGELINTPIQAAQFGFILLWAVLLSCIIKYFLQVEIGRHCLVHHRTTIEALNTCPGPKFWHTSWIALAYLAIYTVTLLTAVGILGALAGLLHSIFPLRAAPATSAQIWATLLILATQILLWRSLYAHIEKTVAVLVAFFSVTVVIGVGLVQGTEFRIESGDVLSGLTFSLGNEPQLAAYAVISLMGALGATPNELFMYPYWVLEKRAGRALGDSHLPQWQQRARQEVFAIKLDVGFATLVATIVTAAFFLLGAAVLHGQGIKPGGLGVVEQISQLFTRTYGAGWRLLFLAGAFCTLYSTLVVVAATTGRMWSDLLCSMQWVDRTNKTAVVRAQRIVQTIYLMGIWIAFLTLQQPPAKLVVFGQFFSCVFSTPLIMFGICWMAFHTQKSVRMSTWTAVLLLGSVLIITTCVIAGLAIERGWLQ